LRPAWLPVWRDRGGNVTGLSSQTADLAAKRLEILREVVPGLRRLAILSNVGNRLAVLEMREVQAAASTFGLEVVTLEIPKDRISRPPSRRSRAARMRSTSVWTPSCLLTEFASTRWRRPRDYR